MHEVEGFVDGLTQGSPMGLMSEREVALSRHVGGTSGMGYVYGALNHDTNEVRAQGLGEIEMWCDMPQTTRRFR